MNRQNQMWNFIFPITTVLLFILCTTPTYGKKMTQLKITNTFSLEIPHQISPVELPSFNSKLFYIDKKSSNAHSSYSAPTQTQVLIVHSPAPTIANMPSINRYWNQSRKQTQFFNEKEQNFGCKKGLTARDYSCSRDVIQDGKFHSETLFWNAKSDLVLLRSSNLKSLSEARKDLEQIKIIQNTRLPAEALHEKQKNLKKSKSSAQFLNDKLQRSSK